MVGVAILGHGVVGSGVAEILEKNASRLAQKSMQDIELLYVLDVREFPDCPYAAKFTKDFSVIENDPRVQVVVETIGGVGVALDFTRRALLGGKNVVSSNKELVAEYGAELLSIARERNLNYLFEASVGGGIPIIRPISQCLAANELHEIYGILNGTTNYILTRMISHGLTMEEALAEAKQHGYAEANPTDDVEGNDACRKICILAALAFGRQIMPSSVSTEGITGVTLRDVRYAASGGMVVKLLGRAKVLDNGNVSAYVAPHLIHRDNPLASVEDVFNGIVVTGDAIGDVMFYGRGAGKMPTASAVVADIIDAAKHLNARKLIFWDKADDNKFEPASAIPSAWYVRAKMSESQARELFGEISMLSCDEAADGEIAFVTPEIGGEMPSAAGIESVMRVL